MKTLILFLLAFLVIATFSCVPVFSTLQSAKLVGKGNFEVAPHFTTTSSTSDGETDHVQTHYGFQLGYGVSPRFDLSARYELISIANDGGNANIFGIGPKVSLVKDRIAAYLPVGFAFGGDIDGIDAFEVQPTVLFTLPVGKYVEINPSVKGIIGDDFWAAFNLGLGLSSDFDKYAIRPEYGILFNPGESGHAGQFSIGLSIKLNKDLLKGK
jgi:hypothetical protein